MILSEICVAKIGPLSLKFCYLYLAERYSQLSVVLPTPQCNKTIYCRIQLCQAKSVEWCILRNLYFASAPLCWLLWALMLVSSWLPTSSCWSLFISALSEVTKVIVTEQVNLYFPFHWRCLINPAVIWCKFAGGNMLPSGFLTSRMNSAEPRCLTSVQLNLFVLQYCSVV